MIIFLILFLWSFYAILEGKREALFWFHRINSKYYHLFKNVDRHPMFSLQRFIVLMLTFIIFQLLYNNIYYSLYFILLNLLVFSFFHNGMLYTERNKLDRISNPNKGTFLYPKKWWDQSTTSTAKLTKFMTPISRTIQMIIGILGYIIFYFLKFS